MWALYAREVHRFRKIWPDTLLSPIISAWLFLAVFGVIMGDRQMGDMNALLFIYSGLLGMTVINGAFMNPGFALVLAKNLGTIGDLQVAPIRKWQVGMAYTLAAATRSLVALSAVLLSSIWLIPDISLTHPAALFFAIVITGVEFGLIGVVFGMLAKSFESVTVMTTFIMQPMIFLGGVFYPISALPGIWSSVSLFNPLYHNINIIRWGLTGYADTAPLISFAFVCLSVAVLTVVMSLASKAKL